MGKQQRAICLRPQDLPPPDADWRTIMKFALTFDGYGHVLSRWPSGLATEACGELAEGVRAALARSDDPTEYSLDDLRAALFWEHRVLHWRGPDEIPSAETVDYCRRLIECIRGRLVGDEGGD